MQNGRFEKKLQTLSHFQSFLYQVDSSSQLDSIGLILWIQEYFFRRWLKGTQRLVGITVTLNNQTFEDLGIHVKFCTLLRKDGHIPGEFFLLIEMRLKTKKHFECNKNKNIIKKKKKNKTNCNSILFICLPTVFVDQSCLAEQKFRVPTDCRLWYSILNYKHCVFVRSIKYFSEHNDCFTRPRHFDTFLH